MVEHSERQSNFFSALLLRYKKRKTVCLLPCSIIPKITPVNVLSFTFFLDLIIPYFWFFCCPRVSKILEIFLQVFFFYFIDFWTNFFSFFFNCCPALSNFCSKKRNKNFSCVQIPSAFSFCSLLFAFASKTCKTCTKNFSKNVRRNASFSTRMGGWCRTVPWTAKARTKRAFWLFYFFA